MAPTVLAVFFAVLICADLPPAMNQVTVSVLKTSGKKFIVYPARLDSLWDRITLYITTQCLTNVQVKIITPMLGGATAPAGVKISLTVNRSHPVTQEVIGVISSQIDILHDGINVMASYDISVFVNNPSSNASGVTSILSYDSLSTAYLFPSIERTYDAQSSILIGNPAPGRNEIVVTLPRSAGSGGSPSLRWKHSDHGPGQTFKIIMNHNEVADIRQQDGKGTGDLTGTQIMSQKPIAVFSASVFYPPPFNGIPPAFRENKDITIENIPPVGSWGRTFVVTATPSTSRGDYIRVMAAQANTNIWSSLGVVRNLQNIGDFVEDELLPKSSVLLQADKPIQVIQYRYQFMADSAPFMFHVPAVESYDNIYTVPIIFNPDANPGFENYIVLITHVCYADRVVLESDLDPRRHQFVTSLSRWKRVGSSSYVTTEVKVNTGFVTIAMLSSGEVKDDANVTVGGFFFGMGPNQAYAAPLGLQWTSGKSTMQWTLPTTTSTEERPIKDGKAYLVARDQRPMTLPAERLLKSRVACHNECFKESLCAFVGYKPQKGSIMTRCELFMSTAECSGHTKEPGYLLYKLHKN
ncbi:IgGFc-binding protein-like [Littorina saxatilis]|uniref:IgGFc-binding protein N-terminal domain-containing protein n=1 Tax=Littorina saxatilis TaxID=31220 RepID=A0AAN9ANL0_9CAEN